MKRVLIIAGVATFVLSSCAVSFANRKQKIYNQTIFTTPMRADVEVDLNKKVTGTSTQKGMDLAKQAALYDAMQKSGADVIVDPIFTVRQVSMKSYQADVTGFYGKYTAIKKLEIADSTLFRINSGGNSGEQSGGAKPKFKLFGKKK